MVVTRLCTYIETLLTDIGYIFTNVSNGCDKNWIRELIKMSQTLLMFSLMLLPLLIQYVSNGCDKIAVNQAFKTVNSHFKMWNQVINHWCQHFAKFFVSINKWQHPAALPFVPNNL